MRRIILATLTLAAVLSAPGCNGRSERISELRFELIQTEDQVRQLQRRNAELQARLQRADEQIETLQALGPRRLEGFVPLQRVRLARGTGLLTAPDQSTALRVLLQPIDRDGHPVKAVGEVRVRLEQRGDDAPRPLAECHLEAPRLAGLWSAGFLTNHYNIVCPLDSPPDQGPLDVVATFTEYLTGRTFTARREIPREPVTDPAAPNPGRAVANTPHPLPPAPKPPL